MNTAYIKLIAIAILVLAAWGLYKHVGNLNKEIEDLQTQNTVLTVQISTQNAAIKALKEESDARLKEAQAQLKIAKEQAEKNKTKAQVIYKTKPSTPGDDCKSALDLINGAQ